MKISELPSSTINTYGFAQCNIILWVLQNIAFYLLSVWSRETSCAASSLLAGALQEQFGPEYRRMRIPCSHSSPQYWRLSLLLFAGRMPSGSALSNKSLCSSTALAIPTDGHTRRTERRTRADKAQHHVSRGMKEKWKKGTSWNIILWEQRLLVKLAVFYE